jgi:hypothetical protein
MALPQAAEARRFYQSARQRFEDARFLLEEGRTTGAVYLAGYAVECILEALILAVIAQPGKRREMLKSFRGSRAHDFGWLKAIYIDNGGATFPAQVAKKFARTNLWSTELRYQPGTIRCREARNMLDAAEGILEWADGRL